MTEVVFELGVEGGSLRITRTKYATGAVFTYHHHEGYPNDKGLAIAEKSDYSTFEEPFQMIVLHYLWHLLYPITLHCDFRCVFLKALVNCLNQNVVSPDDFGHHRAEWERLLEAKIQFGPLPSKSGMMRIKVENIVKFTEHEPREISAGWDAPTIESKFIPRAKFETWLVGEQGFHYDGVMRSSHIAECFEITGNLEIKANSILIKNEFGQILYALPADKFFVSATPLLGKEKGWFYNSLEPC